MEECRVRLYWLKSKQRIRRYPMNARIKWLRDKISRMNMDGMIVSNPVNIRYLMRS